MPFITRPHPSLGNPSGPPSGRRERRPSHAVPGYPDIPFFERSEAVPHPVTQARPEPSASRSPGGSEGQPMGKIIHLATAGMWVIRLNGQLLDIDGRNHWDCRRELAADAARAGIALSDLVVHTGRIG